MNTVLGRRYLFNKPYWAIAQGLIDALGYLIFRPGRAAVPARVRKILVSRIDHFGDVFIASSILPHLKSAYPGAEIHFMAGEWAVKYLESRPEVDRVLVYNSVVHNRSRGFLKNALNAARTFVFNLREIRKEAYDICMDLRAYPFNSLILLYLSGARYKAGFATGGFGFLLDRIVPYRFGVHETEHLSDVLAALGIEAPEEGLKPKYTPPLSAYKECAMMIDSLGIREGEPFVLVHTGSGNRAKLWKSEEWQALVDSVIRDHRIKVAVYDDLGHDIKGCIMLPTLISFEVFAVITKRTRLFIGLDSLPAHLAASFGTPVVVVWCGINDHNQWRPLGGRVRIVRKELGCAPCFRKNGCMTMSCMDISARDCLKEAGRLLEIKARPALKLIQ